MIDGNKLYVTLSYLLFSYFFLDSIIICACFE